MESYQLVAHREKCIVGNKGEKRGTVPSIGLSHAADKTEVRDESTTKGSGSQREGNSPRFSYETKIRKSKQLRLNIKRKEQEPPVPTVGLPYATDKAEVRPGETIKGSDFAYAAGTLNLFLSMDKDMKKSELQDTLPRASL